MEIPIGPGLVFSLSRPSLLYLPNRQTAFEVRKIIQRATVSCFDHAAARNIVLSPPEADTVIFSSEI